MIKKSIDKFIQNSKGVSCKNCSKKTKLFNDSFGATDTIESPIEVNREGFDDEPLLEPIHEERDIEHHEDDNFYDLNY